MKTGTKFAVAGASTGIVTAAVPIAYGVYLSKKRKPLDGDDMLRAENGAFITADSRQTVLTGIDLGSPALRCTRDTEAVSLQPENIFGELEARFGNYGAREIIGKCTDSFITKQDIKEIKKLGINCVRIPVYSYLLFRDGKLKKTEPELDRVDKLVEKFGKAGIYSVLSLEYVPGFEDGREDSFLSQGRKGFALRNAAISMWLKIAAHYKDVPSVAAYDILDRGALGFECDDNAVNFYIRAVKALRNTGDSHIAILQIPEIDESRIEEIKNLNAAIGTGRKYCSFYETQALAAKTKVLGEKGIASFITNLRPSSFTGALEAFGGAGVSGVFTGYKGVKDCIYCGSSPVTDLKLDTYESINEKLADAFATGTYTKNEALENEVRNAAQNIVFRKVIKDPIKIHYSRGKAYSAGI